MTRAAPPTIAAQAPAAMNVERRSKAGLAVSLAGITMVNGSGDLIRTSSQQGAI